LVCVSISTGICLGADIGDQWRGKAKQFGAGLFTVASTLNNPRDYLFDNEGGIR
jgi:hypothetical protein